MPHDNQLDELSSFVNRAEIQRTYQNTTALQNYLDQHPQFADLTLQMTAEIKQKLLFYVGNADKEAQEKLQEELAELGRQLANLSEKPNVLHQLLCEEILTSYLMLRSADTSYARH